jgi:RES domain
VNAPTSRVAWPETYRLVMSRFPPIDLFDDIADPRDWEALALAQSRTNPRIHEEIGDLALVPVERRISGQGASWVMAAFTHVSPDRVSRFSDGTYGVYYVANSLETALYEHTFHMARFYSESGVAPGWLSQVRQLVGSIDADLIDVRGEGFEAILDPDIKSYGASQAFAKEQKAAGANGIVYPSQRLDEGQCIAAFYPNVVSRARQADHFRYHWDGERIDFAQQISGVRTMFQLRC